MAIKNLLHLLKMLMKHRSSFVVLLSLTVLCLWSMKEKSNPRISNFRFIEVGLLVNGLEFYHEFCIPINLSMRRFNDKSQMFEPVSVEDWLTLDFPIILRRKLSALNSSCSIEVHSILNIVPLQRPLSPVVCGDSSPHTWCNTFVYLIASFFVNNWQLYTHSYNLKDYGYNEK